MLGQLQLSDQEYVADDTKVPISLPPQSWSRLLLLSVLGWQGKGGRWRKAGEGRKKALTWAYVMFLYAGKPGTDGATVGAPEERLPEVGKLATPTLGCSLHSQGLLGLSTLSFVFQP